MKLTCDIALTLVADYLALELTASSAADLQAHLTECAACQTETEALFRQDRVLTELAARADDRLARRVEAALTDSLMRPSARPERPILSAQAVRPGVDDAHGIPTLKGSLGVGQSATEPPFQGENSFTSPYPGLTARADRSGPSGRKKAGQNRLLVPRAVAFLVAACLLIAPALLLHWAPPMDPSPARVELPKAQFERVDGEVFVVAADAARVRAKPGLTLLPGQITSVGEEGSATITFSDATRLMLGAFTTVTWSPFENNNAFGRRNVLLTEGALTAEMSTTYPIMFTTPQAEVVAEKAQLSLCQTGLATHVEAEKGTLHVRRRKDGQQVDVPAGAYATVFADGPALNATPMPQRVNESRTTLKQTGEVTSLQFSADGGTLAVLSNAGIITLFEVATGNKRRTLEAPGKVSRVMAFAANGQSAAVGIEKSLSVWNLADDAAKPSLLTSPSNLFALRFEDDGKAAIGCGFDRIVRRWDLTGGKMSVVARLKNYQSDFDFPACMEFNPDGKSLAWGLKDNTTRLWDIASSTEKLVLRGHEGAVTALAFDAVEAMLATGSRDRTICLWDLPSGKLRSTLQGHRHTVNTAAFSPDCRLLATGSSDMTIKLWDVAFAREITTFRGHTGSVYAVAFSPDGKTLASGGLDGTVKLWNVE